MIGRLKKEKSSNIGTKKEEEINYQMQTSNLLLVTYYTRAQLVEI